MNPFLLQVLATVIRAAVVYLAGMLGLGDLLNEYATDVQRFAASAALFLTVVGGAIYSRYKDRQKLVTMGGLAGVSEREAEAFVADPLVPTPSVTTPKNKVPR